MTDETTTTTEEIEINPLDLLFRRMTSDHRLALDMLALIAIASSHHAHGEMKEYETVLEDLCESAYDLLEGPLAEQKDRLDA